MNGFVEYCPIAEATEVLGDRWTPLVLRELMDRGRGFNEIHRGIPRISRTLLSQRLRMLEAQGIVTRNDAGPGRAGEYRLTPAGEGLVPILLSLGQWAARWSFKDPTDEQLDARWLVWQIHKAVVPAAVRPERVCVEWDLRGPGGGRLWIVIEDGSATPCNIDPGYDVDVLVRGENRAAHRWFLGRITLDEARTDGAIEVSGDPTLVAGFSTWIAPNPFAPDIFAARDAAPVG
jgi:DNA-binding HxlR family transcriptional regulator